MAKFLAFALCLTVVNAQLYFSEDGQIRNRRDVVGGLPPPIAPLEARSAINPVYAAPKSDGYHGHGKHGHSHGHYKPGIVGPVYTFVKTDYHGNFKWGVRHVAGKKYAGGHHR